MNTISSEYSPKCIVLRFHKVTVQNHEAGTIAYKPSIIQSHQFLTYQNIILGDCGTIGCKSNTNASTCKNSFTTGIYQHWSSHFLNPILLYRWIGLRNGCISSSIILITSFSAVLYKNEPSSAIICLAMTYAIQVRTYAPTSHTVRVTNCRRFEFSVQ